ncbi:AMD1 [Candida oxycetoniae]|uniref:AMP deaminase n=1 Tax=Candida oxycetoniae TaxID=497107 RepID=A0AAI9SX28_9ASCO|nr:AMD1 [Candida oxycetoniae]KAI3404707.2 AMD1 [Candida oxycetoniae]
MSTKSNLSSQLKGENEDKGRIEEKNQSAGQSFSLLGAPVEMDEYEHGFDEDSDDGLTTTNSAHFSTSQDRFIKDQDLKQKTLEALHSGHGSGMPQPSPPPLQSLPQSLSSSSPPPQQQPGLINISSKRQPSVIDMPYHNFHPSPGQASHLMAANSGSNSTATSAFPEEYPSDELIEYYENVRICLDFRHKYLNLSLQTPESSNPKNKSEWKIYPPPPKPTYKSKNKFNRILKPAGKKKEKKEKTDNQEKDAREVKGEGEDDGDGDGDDDDDEEEEIFDFNKCTIPDLSESEYYFTLDSEGVFQVYDSKDEKQVTIPNLHQYYYDLSVMSRISSDGPTKSFAFKRLQYLEAKWNMYYLLNEFEETKKSKQNPHRDFYNVRKVDTHIHQSACMNQKHLLRFIKYKLKTDPDSPVIFRDGKILTLAEVFKSLNLTAYDLSIDTLDMHAHTDTFHRFDKFNLKYNPIGESRLREIFLKTDNFIKGKYLAELTGQVMEDLESSKYQMSELRISIYGRSIHEWDKLAAWIVDNKLFSHNVRWLIQVPRLYDVYKKNGNVNSFLEIVKNVFEPLFEVSRNPKTHPKLYVFLQRVVGFDSVDDESKAEKPIQSRKYPPASEWNFTTNPPYSYYLYYLFANIASLNHLRLKNDMNTFVLRPHCGEAGDPEHLISAFLTSYGISHGILLRKLPFIQYLYYLDQIGIAMSPLSNNALFLTYDKNPFYNFFKKGLNVSLSTDDPLQFSYTKEPLIEEYSVAAQIYKLSSVDMCELARNSCLQSGWEATIKKHWLGKNYMAGGVAGNNIEKTNVPDIRVGYREDALKSEQHLVDYYTSINRNEAASRSH